jgi:hypothetical protein
VLSFVLSPDAIQRRFSTPDMKAPVGLLNLDLELLPLKQPQHAKGSPLLRRFWTYPPVPSAELAVFIEQSDVRVGLCSYPC